MFFNRSMKLFILVSSVAVLLSGYLILGIPAMGASNPNPGPVSEAAATPEAEVETITFDVAEDATRFVFDEEPVHTDDLPAYGNSFVTQGYIYPEGTLTGSNGVISNEDGTVEPEFPEKVIGEWTCRGWFVGQGAHTETGPWVITTQFYNLSDTPGETALVTEGYELADLNEPIRRAITGGTGEYNQAQGEAVQELLGFNAAEGVNLRFELHVTKP